MLATTEAMPVDTTMQTQDRIIIGKIGSAYGIKGWVKVQSFTDPIDNILDYAPWYIFYQKQWQAIELMAGKPHGKGIIVQLQGCQDRNQAELYRGCEIAMGVEQLPPLDENEYYWNELIGLTVQTIEGTTLGTVDYLFTTGANDVLVLKGQKQRLIPFLQGQVVKKVDREKRLIIVHWDPEF